jgi:hypothetical protein
VEKFRHGGGGYLTAAARPLVCAGDGRRALLLVAAVSREYEGGERHRENQSSADRANYSSILQQQYHGVGISAELPCCHRTRQEAAELFS